MSKTVKTNMYGDKAVQILNSLLDQFADGYWENSSRMEGAWRFIIDICRARDNEILVIVDTETMHDRSGHRNPYFNMPDADVLKYLGTHIKTLVKAELSDNSGSLGTWSHSNFHELTYLGYGKAISVSDAYLAYDSLLNRNVDGKYTTEVMNSVVGHPISEAEFNAIEEKKAKISAIMRDYHSKVENLDYMRKIALDQVEREFQQKMASMAA